MPCPGNPPKARSPSLAGLASLFSFCDGSPDVLFCCLVFFWHEGKSISYGGDGLLAQSCPTLVTPWTVAHQALLSMEFPRQKCWSELLFPSPGDLPNPGTESRSPDLQVDPLLTELGIYFL